MNGLNDRAEEIEALRCLLDAYGSDQARWPAGAPDRFRSLLADVPAAQTLLAEARALDRVLDRAPRPSLEQTRALAERIVAAAAAGKAGTSGSEGMDGRVIAFPTRINRNPLDLLRPAASRSLSAVGASVRGIGRAAATADRSVWQTAALLAACLVVGVYLGASPAVTPVLQNLAESLGVATEVDSTSYAFFDESLDEDTL